MEHGGGSHRNFMYDKGIRVAILGKARDVERFTKAGNLGTVVLNREAEEHEEG